MEGTNKYRISAVICTHNRIDIIKKCIDALIEQSLANDLFEILVIDNNCTDGTAEYVKGMLGEHENLNYYFEPNLGLSHARNRGIKEAGSEIIVFIDDDAIACRHLIEIYLSKYDANPELECIGGPVYQKIGFKVPSWMLKFFKPYIVLGYQQGHEERFLDGLHGPVGANISFRKKVFDRCGYFDPNLGRTGKNYLANEEERLLYCIKEEPGACLYVPDAYVLHVANKERIGRKYLLKRAYDKGMSDARAGYSREQIRHKFSQPIYLQVLGVAFNMYIHIKELLLFHGLLSIVYKYSFYREKHRKCSEHIVDS